MSHSSGSPSRPVPTPLSPRPTDEFRRWSQVFAGPGYAYGCEAGPIARRAVRYHRPEMPAGGRALDLGCGEGQDLAYLAAEGYEVTGIEFTPGGAGKALRMLAERGLRGEVLEVDMADYLRADPERPYDLVLASNSLQFTGPACPELLDRLRVWTAPGGIGAVSLFGREPGTPSLAGGVYLETFEDLLRRFEDWDPREAARLWQWGYPGGRPQEFVTLIARRPA